MTTGGPGFRDVVRSWVMVAFVWVGWLAAVGKILIAIPDMAEGVTLIAGSFVVDSRFESIEVVSMGVAALVGVLFAILLSGFIFVIGNLAISATRDAADKTTLWLEQRSVVDE